MYDYGWRQYMPDLGRWVHVDPLADYNPFYNKEHYIDGQHNGGVYNSGNLNPYVYCYQSPVNYIDPNGKQVKTEGRIDNYKTQLSFKWGTGENWDGNLNFYARHGIIYNYVRGTRLKVDLITSIYYDNPVPDENGNYKKSWTNVNELDPYYRQNVTSNCYGWVLTNGKYYISAESKQVSNFLQEIGYKNLGNPNDKTKYQKGDILLWDGHIIEAVKNDKNGLIWESKFGTGSVEKGTLKEILDVNSSNGIEYGNTKNATLLRRPEKKTQESSKL